MVELIAAWEPQDDEQRYIQWAQNLSQALAPYAFKGGYINLLDEQEQSAFGFLPSSNYERLLDLKQKYDPDDVFRSTIGHLAPIRSHGKTLRYLEHSQLQEIQMTTQTSSTLGSNSEFDANRSCLLECTEL